MEKFEYSLLGVCQDFYGDISGTSDPLIKSEFEKRLVWLRWRIHEAWDWSTRTPSKFSFD